MADQARVSSIEALESFRASLIVFITKAHRSIDDVGDEVRRLRTWLQSDQRFFWDRELRKRQRALSLAEQELFAARLSNLRDDTRMQEMAVRRAREAVAEAEEKGRKVKLWSRDFEHSVEPLVKRLDTLRHTLDFDLPKALAFLLQAQQTLDAYAAIAPKPPAAGSDAASGDASMP